MKTLTNKVTLINVISSLLFQILTIINGFIIPRLILSYFGSDVNGLTTSISQFLTYISLIEGGITGVIMASLYKPLYEKDYCGFIVNLMHVVHIDRSNRMLEQRACSCV